MGDINNFVEVVIRLQGGGPTKVGFGTVLIAGPHTLFTERIQFFTDLDGITDLGADNDHGTLNGLVANAALTAFSQSPKPSRIAIGRAQVDSVDIVVEEGEIGFEYIVTLDGTDYSHVAATDVPATIATALAAVLDAVSGFGAAAVGAVITLDVDTPGTAFTAVIGDKMTASPTTGSVEDFDTALGLIQDESDDWYPLTILERDITIQEDVAAWIEANGSPKFFRYASTDSNIPIVDITDILSILKALNYEKSSGIYHTKADGTMADEWIDVAWNVMAASYDPDVETATDKFKSFKGITPDVITPTQRAIIIGTEDDPTSGKNGNIYTTVSGKNVTQSGITASGEWNDVILGADWLKVRMEERIFNVFTINPKVLFSDAGIASLASEIRAQLQIGLNTQFLLFNSELDPAFGFYVKTPTRAESSSSDITNRILKTLEWEATIGGAIHAAKPIRGTLAP